MMELVLRKCPCLRPEAEEIRVLDFRHCTLSDVPNEVFNFERTLEELYLDSNKIYDLPRPLFHCHGLRILGISDNEIHILPHAIASLINLEELDISKNGILAIPDNIKGCKCLRVLEASVNPLGKLSDGFTQLINLEELYLNDTFVDFLPANFGRLSKLRILELRENHLKSLPKSMGRLTELSRLDIGQNDFKDLPDVIGDLCQLSELWCDYNRISFLPQFFGNLKVLTYFDASKNRIQSIPYEIENCVNLTDVNLSCNNLRTLPESIGNLKLLVTLKLEDNEINVLPNSIGWLSNLQELILNQNDLKKLPSSIGLLRQMHTLILDDNLLEDLPAELGSCTSLTILSAHGNRLKSIPDELGHIPDLKIINISNNCLRYLPFSITKLRNLHALWLSENQNKPLIPLQGDIDINSGKRVLTCYIFPQEQGGNVGMSASSSFSRDVQESKVSTRPHIKFAVDESFESKGKLIRNPTPYPKELKAHIKHARNQALKNKMANYVNIDAVLKETDSEPNDTLALSVVQEVGVWPESPSVVVKEAFVTKPSSPRPSPKLHGWHSLYKQDKEKFAKDKARLLNHLAAEDVRQQDSEQLSVIGIQSAGEDSNEDVKEKRSASLSIRKKIEVLRKGKSSLKCLKSDRSNCSHEDLYTNVNAEELKQDMNSSPSTLDGYSSDWEVLKNAKMSDAGKMIAPMIKIAKSATISAAVAKKLPNYNLNERGEASKRSLESKTPIYGAGSVFRERSDNASLVSPSTDDRFTGSGNSSCESIKLERRHVPPDVLPKFADSGNVRLSPSRERDKLQCLSQTPQIFSCKRPVRVGPPSPSPSLPPRMSTKLSVATHSPLLPSRQHPALPKSSSSCKSELWSVTPKQDSTSAALLPGMCIAKPPPYHIAATYSKHPFESLYEPVQCQSFGASSNVTSQKSPASGMRITQASVAGSVLAPSPPREPHEFFTSSPWNDRRFRHNVPSFRPVCPVVSVQDKGRASNLEMDQPLSINASAVERQKLAHQRSCSSVDGAYVYDNPYAICDGLKNSQEQQTTCRVLSKELSQSDNFFSRSNAKHCSGTPPPPRSANVSPGRTAQNNSKMQSLSAPSTPVLGESLPALPPYRSPPLYQSASTGSLNNVKLTPERVLPPVSNTFCSVSSVPIRYNQALEILPKTCRQTCNEETSVASLPETSLQSVPHTYVGQMAGCRYDGQAHLQVSKLPASVNVERSACSTQVVQCVDRIPRSVQKRQELASGEDASEEDCGLFTARPIIIDNGNDASSAGCGAIQTVRKYSSDTALKMLTSQKELLSGKYSNGHYNSPSATYNTSKCAMDIPKSTLVPDESSSTSGVNYKTSGDIYENVSFVKSSVKTANSDIPWVFGRHHNPKVIPVVLHRNPDFGFGISSFIDNSGRSRDKGIFITSVTPGGAASSVLKPGDKLLQVDGTDVSNLDLCETQHVLDCCGSTVFLMISRE